MEGVLKVKPWTEITRNELEDGKVSINPLELLETARLVFAIINSGIRPIEVKRW